MRDLTKEIEFLSELEKLKTYTGTTALSIKAVQKTVQNILGTWL